VVVDEVVTDRGDDLLNLLIVGHADGRQAHTLVDRDQKLGRRTREGDALPVMHDLAREETAQLVGAARASLQAFVNRG
jgi:hypothetical protein